MKTWIHLKSDNLADALALATILRESDKSFHIVRRSFNAYVFAGLNNVILDYYEKSEDCEIIVIDEISTDIWQEKCNNIATKIGVITQGKHVPYLGFTKQNKEIERMWGENKSILLYLFPHQDQKLNLMVVEQFARMFEQKGIKTISGGTKAMPCIRGTKDLRQLVDLSVLCNVKDKILFVLTSEKFMKTIGDALGLNIYVIADITGLTINNIPMLDANQMVNYIEINNRL